MLNDKQVLRDFAAAVAIPVYYTDPVKWPFKAGGVLQPVLPEYGEYFVSMFDDFDTSNVRQHFWCAAQLMRCCHPWLLGMEAAGLSRDEVAGRVLKLAKGVLELQGRQYFIEYDDYCVAQDVSVGNTLQTPLLLQLATALWAYSETLFFVHRNEACEYHGNYALTDGNNAIVRDFNNLKPSDLWAEFDFAGMPSTVRIATAHSPDFVCDFDNYNNLYVREGSMAQSLQYGEVIVDGKSVGVTEAAELLTLVSAKLGEFHEVIENMGDVAVKHKYIDIFWYRCKPFADYSGRDWRPSEAIHAKAGAAFRAVGAIAAGQGAKANFEEFRKEFDYSMFLG